jgi:hypothetical protein
MAGGFEVGTKAVEFIAGHQPNFGDWVWFGKRWARFYPLSQ